MMKHIFISKFQITENHRKLKKWTSGKRCYVTKSKLDVQFVRKYIQKQNLVTQMWKKSSKTCFGMFHFTITLNELLLVVLFHNFLTGIKV